MFRIVVDEIREAIGWWKLKIWEDEGEKCEKGEIGGKGEKCEKGEIGGAQVLGAILASLSICRRRARTG